jgi:hypothetical protein
MGSLGGDRPTTGGTLGASVGRRWNRLLLRGGLGLGGVTWSAAPGDDRDGSLTRVDLTARYAFARTKLARGKLGFDLWVEAGAGREWLRWEEGGKLARDGVVLGIGLDEVLAFSSDDSKARVLRGVIAFRWFIPPESDEGDMTAAEAMASPGELGTGWQAQVGFSWGW